MKTPQKMPIPMSAMTDATEPTTEVTLPRSKVSFRKELIWFWMVNPGSRLGKVVTIHSSMPSSIAPKPAELYEAACMLAEMFWTMP